MILPMSKVRILAPRDRLDEVFAALQDFGLLHLAPVADRPGLSARRLLPREVSERRALERLANLLDALATRAGLPPSGAPVAGRPTRAELARWARLARRVRRELDGLDAEIARREGEQAALERYRAFLEAVGPLVRAARQLPDCTAYAVLLPRAAPDESARLEERLRRAVGDVFSSSTHRLPGDETAVLFLVPADRSAQLESALAEARVPEIPLPEGYRGPGLVDLVPRLLRRLEEIPRELERLRTQRARVCAEHGSELARARAAVHDGLAELGARTLAGVTERAAVVEGWCPRSAVPALAAALERRVPEVLVEELHREEWSSEEAPVVLRNPRLFQPFEALVRLVRLPRYGTIDPTPFVAVFFPMFFGLILGDIGYGALLAALGLVLHARSRPGTTLRTLSEIIGPCAAFSIVFGALYGEAFGDLGRRWGLRALFDRHEAATAFLVLALGLGLVHVLLGLALGVLSARRGHPRQALGRGLAGVMVVLVALALLAALRVLPSALFTPAVVGLLVAFPVLVAVEGVAAAVEFLGTLGNVLSYARIMALGTASVMLAAVANRMAGAIGSAVIGIVFALLFHLVNFALGLLSPTIHALRLHYVEFFGKFYSPGGRRYEPFAHWRPPAEARP